MKALISSIAILAVVGLSVGSTTMAGETVTASVTIGSVSVTVSPTSLDYGTIPFSTSKESFDSSLASNNISATVGTAVTDVDIKGADATGTTPWTLDTVANVASNKYAHTFSPAANGTTRPAAFDAVALTKTFDGNLLVDGAAGSSTTWFGLKIYTPTGGDATVHSAAVTLQATFGG